MKTNLNATSSTTAPHVSFPDTQGHFQFAHYVPIIKAIARPYLKHLPASLELDDLVSVGMCGLWEAMARFDASRNIPFEAFARYRIRGAILDEIRRMSWVSRKSLQCIGLVKKTEGELGQRHGQYPTTQQVASHLGRSIPWVDAIKQQSQKVTIQRLSGLSESSDEATRLSPSLDHTPLELYEQKEQAEVTREALDALPPSESKVLFEYYFAEVPMKMIGENLGVSESRISQIHSRAIDQLRINHWTSPLREFVGDVA